MEDISVYSGNFFKVYFADKNYTGWTGKFEGLRTKVHVYSFILKIKVHSFSLKPPQRLKSSEYT